MPNCFYVFIVFATLERENKPETDKQYRTLRNRNAASDWMLD